MTNENTTETTTETTTNSKPAKVKKNTYPFRSKRDILAQIEIDDEAVIEAMGILYQRQTEDEKETKETKYKNRRGFMSSHAVNGTRLVEKMMGGEEWDEADLAKARSIACRYGKQLAAHFRQEVLEGNPDLAAEVACFFKPQ